METNSLRLPPRDLEMPSNNHSEGADRELAARLQQQYNNEDAAIRSSRQSQQPQHNHHQQGLAPRQAETGNGGSGKKPDRLIVGLIILLFVVGTIAVGLLQFQHGEDLKRQGKQPRIFDDYFVSTFNGTIILRASETLYPGEYATSPSGQYRVGLTLEGDLVVEEIIQEDPWYETMMINETNTTENVFSTRAESNPDDVVETRTIWSAGVTTGVEAFMQTDGNLVVKTAAGTKVWASGTHEHAGATLIVDDGGRIGVRFMESLIWFQGKPQGTYRGPSSRDLTFPVRGAFYYAWYPQTWTVSTGETARFKPDLGYYVSGDPKVIDSHIDQLEYGKFDVGIISWFGPSSNLDIARITNLMDRTLELNAKIKWTLYYEDEWALDPNHTQLKEDFEYIKKHFAWHPAYAHVDGKPLIFVWNEDECEVVDRWVKATNNEWYIIPKLFRGYLDCPQQPNEWHQYGPASAYARFPGHSVSISPGFWHAREPRPRLPRLSESEWCNNVRRMVQSGEPWQLVTTFNEAGEGTGIESTAAYWPSQSGYGYYLDCLHLIP